MRTSVLEKAGVTLLAAFLLAGCASALASLAPAGGGALWVAAFLGPAFVVLAIHALILGVWRRGVTRRVRRRADRALMRGDLDSIRRVAAETAEARRDWPGAALRETGGALETMRRRLESGVAPANGD